MSADRFWLKSYDPGRTPDIEIPDVTFTDMINQCVKKYPDMVAFHFMGSEMKFSEFDDLSARFANFLYSIGLRTGDVIGVCSPNSPQYLIALAGAQRAGCAVTGISPLMVAKEMAFQLSDSGAKALVILDQLFEAIFRRIDEPLPDLSHVLVTGITDFMPEEKRPPAKELPKMETRTVSPFLEVLKTYEPRLPETSLTPDSTCMIQYTGGTTGPPKGALLTHRNYVANVPQMTEWIETRPGEDVWCCGFPFFHIAGLSVGMASISRGVTQILIPDPRNTKYICSEIERIKPTIMGMVPSLWQMLLAEPAFKSIDHSGCRACLSGAAPLAVEVFKEIEDVVGKGKMVEVYGMTETTPFMTMNPFRGVKKIGSVGVPIQNTYIRLVDLQEGLEEVPLGEEGQIVCSGPQVMKGYLNKPEETANALVEFDGKTWLYTGDVAKMDEDGFVFIVDRTKDMLNVSGYKVFSKEAEETLYGHPAVMFCAIVGLPNPERPGADIVKAVIQLKDPNQDLEKIKQDILEYCRENMAHYKVPKVMEIVEAIPLTSVGKVDKKQLR